MITVVRSSDPVEVRELLELQRPSAAAAAAGVHRYYRTTGYAQHRHDAWQVVASEGQTAFVATSDRVPRLQVPWIGLTRHGPAARIDLAGQEPVRGFYVQARRMKDEVELQIYQFGGRAQPGGAPGSPGTGLRTVLHGRPGRWLDAGGNLMLEDMPDAKRGYRVQHRDPRQSRILIRVDRLD